VLVSATPGLIEDDMTHTIPGTSLSVYPLCLGGNVFGWSADEAESRDVLNRFTASGGDFIDTADMYSEWAPGNRGGESETIIGNWLRDRGNRNSIVIASKVAKLSTRTGLSAKNIISACEDSLKQLRTDYIDLYYAHEDDSAVPMEDSLRAFDSLVKSGKVRFIASSNFSPERMKEALDTSNRLGLSSYVAVQNLYNLLDRSQYESGMRSLIETQKLSILPYFSLARGFLSGKYRPGKPVKSVRAASVEQYCNERGWRLLATVESLAQNYSTTLPAIALAWLRAQPSVSVPIASARTVEQLDALMPIITLSAADRKRLE
jgi:aryl-alcohol dehydrogenase-like predicted oxidoreductase